MKNKKTLKEVATYYLFLRMAQRFGKENIEEFNEQNNFSFPKSSMLLFLMCTASTNRNLMFDLYAFKASIKSPWIFEKNVLIKWNAPIIIGEKHSIHWNLFGITLKEDGLYAQKKPGLISSILSNFLNGEDVAKFRELAIVIENTITKIQSRRYPDLIFLEHSSLYGILSRHTSWMLYKDKPYAEDCIPNDLLKRERSILGSGKHYIFA